MKKKILVMLMLGVIFASCQNEETGLDESTNTDSNGDENSNSNTLSIGDQFKEGKLYYKITKLTPTKEVETTYQNNPRKKINGLTQLCWDHSEEPKGNLIIPATINHNGNEFSVTSIGEQSFYYCKELQLLVIPNSVKKIGKEAFQYCYELSSVTTPDIDAEVGEVTFSNSLISIEEKAFSFCKHIESLTIPNSVKSIGAFAFSTTSKLTSVTLSNSLTSIEEHTFGQSRLESITIPNSVTNIGKRAFTDTPLTSITVPNSVTSIGEGAFRTCNALKSVTIGKSVTSIGSGAFSSPYINSITCKIENLAWVQIDVYMFTDVSNKDQVVVKVPKGKVNHYKTHKQFKMFPNISEID